MHLKDLKPLQISLQLPARIPVIGRYAAVTMPPMLMLLLAGTAWGGFAWGALLWLTLVTVLADKLLDLPSAASAEEEAAPWADTLSVGLAVGHLLILLSTTAALVSGQLTFGQGLALFFATASFVGQVSHPNAHELIHRRAPGPKALGALVYTSIGFGHHVSAHRLVHHRYVGSDRDPNTPQPGEGFWTYLPRAWRGSFEAGLECEIDRLERKDRSPYHPTNPYWLWILGAFAVLIVVAMNAGPFGVLMAILLSFLGGAQILMSDYLQHYGLQRLILPDGRLEPVGSHHSWNAPRGFSSYLMMNAPAHSEHHMHPDRTYERLDPTAPVPTLPYGMPVMAMIAMVPNAWRRMMDKRAVKVMEAVQAASISAQVEPVAASPSVPEASTIAPNGRANAPTKLQEGPIEIAASNEDAETAAILAQIRAATR